MPLWWDDDYIIVDLFRKQYGEPVECLEVEDMLVAICSIYGDVKKWFSESYFKTSPN